MVKLLLEHGANIIHRFKSGLTPLLLVGYKGHESVVETLLTFDGGKTDLNSKNSADSTALHEKVVETRPAFDGGTIDFNSENSADSMALQAAAQGGHRLIVERLLREKVAINRQNRDGFTPLMFASIYAHDLAVKRFLMVPEINVDLADKDGHTPFALLGHHLVIEQLLMKGGVNINIRTATGSDTPLLGAARGGYDSVVQHLILQKD